MVALLRPEHVPADLSDDGSASRPRLRLVGGAPVDHVPADRAQAQPSSGSKPLAGLVVVLGLVVLMVIVLLRVAQGTPPAASWDGLADSAYGSATHDAVLQPAGPADEVRVVEAGDTLWAIALELRPESDPRPVVDALAERNGGAALQVGQRLVVPGDLLVD